MSYLFHLLIYLGVYAIVALSLNMIVGYAGLLSLAHAGYFAVGGYTYALATLKLGLSFVPATLLSASIAALLSLALSLPSWRFDGDFFVMISLVVQVMVYRLLYNWSSPNTEIGTWSNLTNGPYGISGITNPSVFGATFDSIGGTLIVASFISLSCIIVVGLLLQSPWGRLLKVMRDDELAARSLGKEVRKTKVQVFSVSCGLAAVGGAMYAAYVGYIDPSLATLDEAILLLSFVLVGGVGNLRGPILGAAVLILLPEILRLVALPDAIAAEVRLMIYGLLLVGMMHFRPQGLAGVYRPE
jgi:branched-chain amino acid transport system permease protein